MTISAAYENSATIGTTEYSLPNNSTVLTPITVDGIYQCFLNLTNLVAGDEFLFRVYEKVASAGSQVVVYEATFVGKQNPAGFIVPALTLLHGWDMTLDRIAGADRSIEWSIRAVQ